MCFIPHTPQNFALSFNLLSHDGQKLALTGSDGFGDFECL